MLRTWLTLALLCSALVAGCSQSHGGGDPPPPPPPGSDASVPPPPPPPPPPGCEVGEDPILGLSCPSVVAPGAPVVVRVDHGPGECCAPSVAEPSVSRSGSAFDVRLYRPLCECCFDCDCAGPVLTTEVDLGPQMPGRYTVEAGGSTCTFVVVEDEPPPPPPAECGAVPADEVRMPRTLLEGQTLTISTLTGITGGCGCSPRLDYGASGALELLTCGCCDLCGCVDSGYEASWEGMPPPGGLDHTIVVSRVERPLAVRDRSACAPLEPTGLRVVPPGEGLVRDGPGIYWAVVEAEEFLCCGPHLPAVDELPTSFGRALELLTCSQDPCDCDCGPDDCAPDPIEAWHPLGPLPPGTHSIRAGSHEVTVTVP